VNDAPFVRLDPRDNVAVAGADLPAGTVVEIEGERLVLKSWISAAHKFALVDIQAGAPVLKYGEIIGAASAPIRAGEHVHLYNLRSLRDSAEAKARFQCN
jgi:hypothetical protein